LAMTRHKHALPPAEGEHQAAMAAVFKNADAKASAMRALARSGGGDSLTANSAPVASPSPSRVKRGRLIVAGRVGMVGLRPMRTRGKPWRHFC
jgi:hypothetical protein